MDRRSFRLLVVLLCFSHLISLNAIPISRIRSLMHGSQGHGVLENTQSAKTEKFMGEEGIERRMEAELNDYPGWGSNNRHTPSPRRSCVDC